MINRPKLSSLLPSQVPEFVREDYTTFIDFLKVYYDFLEQNYDTDIVKVRDLDTTLDAFIDQFKNELAHNIPYTVVNERFLLEKIKDQYLAKGSEASFKLLFKILFNKNVVVDYPSKQILRASDGRWNQDVSVFAYVNAGNPADIVGKLVDVITPNRIIRVQVDKRQYVEIEVDNAVQISEHIYELFIDRRFFGDINIGDKMRYSDVFDATILSTTSKVQIQRAGKKFKVGELYEIRNGDGKGSILKVSRVNTAGSIEALEFVRYGIGYTNDFTANLLPYGGTSATQAGATGLTISGVSPNTSVAFSETTDGFFEQGIINRTDYNVTEYWDGTYVGETVREFFVDNKYAILDPEEPAVVKIILGPLTKYPGYYTTNDGFLDDAIFIQDSKYYQAFAYVLKIDERLEKYRSAVKTLIHPAGMALFGEFDIRNEFDPGISLEFALKYLVVSLQDEVQTEDSSFIKLSSKRLDETITPSESNVTLVNKPINNHYLNNGSTPDENIVTPSIADPILNFSKRVNSSYLNDGTTLDDNTVTPSEATIDYEYSALTRKGISTLVITKLLSQNQSPYYLNNGSTLGDDSFILSDFLGAKEISKTLDIHKLYDNLTSDTSSVTMSDTTGTNSTRTVPYVVLNKSLATHYLNDGVTPDTSEVGSTDSGGSLWLSPYTDPYPISSSYFANDSGNYTEGESAFTG
jgi:hypothetical protein